MTEKHPWRVGRHVGRTIYQQVGPEPSDDDVLIGVMDTPGQAAEAVRARNVFAAAPIRAAEEILRLRAALAVAERSMPKVTAVEPSPAVQAQIQAWYESMDSLPCGCNGVEDMGICDMCEREVPRETLTSRGGLLGLCPDCDSGRPQ